MADFLLELRSEEIPARMQARARGDLAKMFAEELAKAGLRTGAIEAFSTPRRLALVARDVAAETEAAREEIKGPKASAPPQALDGFLRKTGLAREQLEERDGVLFAVIDRPGRPAAAVIGEALARIIADFPWPKAMRWGSGDTRWVRPLHGIVALLGEEIVPVEIGGVASGATTLGHRFHHPGVITIGGAGDYAQKLRACHVIVDQDERERLIRDGAAKAAANAGLELLPDEGLVVENAGLTEWPVPLLGRFDADYLDVPREVIVLTMRTHQKYFACMDGDGALAPAFVCVANIDAHDGGEAIVEGNRRVLAARLADARFFWEQDLKVPLDEQAKKLSGIVFHEKLGTVADKVERVARLARWLVEQHIVIPAQAGTQRHQKKLGSRLRGNDEELAALADQAERAARLAKADLVTGMVGEFPELQGVIGGYLAAAQGEPPEVAVAIRDHYKPSGQGDEVPTAPVTVAVALADRLDTLFAFFSYDMLPTGSKDPFALRRAGLGVLGLIDSSKLQLMLSKASEDWAHDRASASLGLRIADFLFERMGVLLQDQGVRHDFIQASRAWGQGNETDGRVDRVAARSRALTEFLNTNDGADLLVAYKRAANILKREDWRGIEGEIAQTGEEDPLVGVDDPDLADVIAAKMAERHGREGQGALASEEVALVAALDAAEPEATAAVEAEDFTGAMAALARLRGPIDDFFDHVTVNDPDPAKRERRLNLLLRFRDAVHRVADFSRIEG